MRENKPSLQLDETTISTTHKDAYLSYYERSINNDNNFVEDLLFLQAHFNKL